MKIEEKIKFKKGQKIYFAFEKRPYTVKACNERFAVCTKPYNLKKTVFYTIIDLDRNVRGTENLIFCMGYETDELCAEGLERLAKGESEVSHRNKVPIDILKIVDPN